jgi:hypothetical protein
MIASTQHLPATLAREDQSGMSSWVKLTWQFNQTPEHDRRVEQPSHRNIRDRRIDWFHGLKNRHIKTIMPLPEETCSAK